MSKVSPITNIPNKSSEGSDWIQWHKTLKDNFGKKQANDLFLKAWRKQGATYSANTKELRDYLGKNGIDIEKGVLSAAYDAGTGVIDDIGDFLMIGKYVMYAVAGIAVIGLGMAVYNLAKNPAQNAGIAAKAML